jgi:hypothetical protein
VTHAKLEEAKSTEGECQVVMTSVCRSKFGQGGELNVYGASIALCANGQTNVLGRR